MLVFPASHYHKKDPENLPRMKPFHLLHTNPSLDQMNHAVYHASFNLVININQPIFCLKVN